MPIGSSLTRPPTMLLTGLPNRAHLVTLINDAIGSAEYRWGAVLFIDLDKFKVINDELGHHAGDTVLEVAAQRLRAALGPDDVVGRVGGDEFVALLAAPIQRVKVNALVRRLHTALRKPIRIPGVSACRPTSRVHIGASIGVVAVLPDEQRCAAEILRAADAAMYRGQDDRWDDMPLRRSRLSGERTARSPPAVPRSRFGREWLLAGRAMSVAVQVPEDARPTGPGPARSDS